MIAAPVAYIEAIANGFQAVQYIDTKRCIISTRRKRESLIRFLTQNGYRIVSEAEQSA